MKSYIFPFVKTSDFRTDFMCNYIFPHVLVHYGFCTSKWKYPIIARPPVPVTSPGAGMNRSTSCQRTMRKTDLCTMNMCNPKCWYFTNICVHKLDNLSTFCEWIWCFPCHKLSQSNQEVKDTHESHVVEEHCELSTVWSWAKMHLHLKAFMLFRTRRWLQDAGENIWSWIHWLIS